MKSATILLIALSVIAQVISGCTHTEAASHDETAEHEQHTIWVTSPNKQDVTITQQYVCQIHSRRHIDVCTLQSGYLEEIEVNEGQKVAAGDALFKILPTLYEARLEAERAEAEVARIECNNTRKLVEQQVVSGPELALAEAKLAKAEAQVKLAEVELNFTVIKAPFDGIIDRLHEQQGSLVDEGDMLTTLSDNSLMWVYFNVPEAQYLEYMADEEKASATHAIELVLANGQTFSESGSIGAIEANFNNETGNIAFRADFPNPNFLLRHGQTGKVLIHRTSQGALVIPQRATFTILAKRYVYVVGADNVVRQREIEVEHELDDIFVLESGLTKDEKFVIEGVAQVRDGQKLEQYKVRSPYEALSNQKFHAE
ncbi:MAG: efflux RND transporter periplasmic adaptor subunit [Phycisphaerales bacterium]|nr:efflux RND transporter periplasmic adaptor subunit [Phycisphaerales bacterium]MCB9854238.1 efflux RND transporter periplasmic adaptor subunit [Phycisphaerales bacterium]MCB9864754.1 efflux RND transporter periplasmic adaptor subunit [Phycisphaerales bacterium]